MIKDIIDVYKENGGPVNGQLFMVKSVTKALDSKGSPYFTVLLQDSTGTLEARKWSIDDVDIAVIVPGSIIRVDGLYQVFKGHPQLKINDVEGVSDSEVDMSRFIPTAPYDLGKLKAKLDDYINLIQDEELKTLTETMIKEHYQDYTSYPAAVTVHHAYMGGLLYHSLSICAMAIKTADQYQYLKKDYLIAGSLLHDIGKIKEFSGYKAVNYTNEGNLLGHITIGAMMVYEKGKELHIDEEKLLVLTHMILSHHGKPEFGSAKVPMTSEAFVLHMLDEMDSKLELLKGAYQATEEGEFTQRIPWMDNQVFYKPMDLDENNKK